MAVMRGVTPRGRLVNTPNESEWEATPVQNLTRYRASGTYCARFRVGRKVIWKSHKTTAFSVARQRLADMMREHRARVQSVTAFANGKMNVGDAAAVYLPKVKANVSLKPRSKDYREMMIDFIRGSWPVRAECTCVAGRFAVEIFMAGQGSTGNVIAALCSFVIPGLGQLLQGRLLMAIVQFCLAGVLWIFLLGWLIHLWSIIDAAVWKSRV